MSRSPRRTVIGDSISIGWIGRCGIDDEAGIGEHQLLRDRVSREVGSVHEYTMTRWWKIGLGDGELVGKRRSLSDDALDRRCMFRLRRYGGRGYERLVECETDTHLSAGADS